MGIENFEQCSDSDLIYTCFQKKIVMSISVCLQSKKLDKESARSLVFLLYRSEYYSL